ncbi:hypothetical protein ACMATS_05245 [Streptoverticillium reticulum]|uniref:hypothetical protein n=1 Tax=Streptoverticillium reticulum TaxID=1433415 RepID=UPI0039BF49B0
MDAEYLLVHGQPGEAAADQSLGDDSVLGAGQTGQENGEWHVIFLSAARVLGVASGCRCERTAARL